MVVVAIESVVVVAVAVGTFSVGRVGRKGAVLGCCDRASDGPSRRRRRASWDDVDWPPKPKAGACVGEVAGAGCPKDEWKPKLGLGESRDEWKEVRELRRGGKKGASDGVEGWLDCRAGCGGSGCVCCCWSGQVPKIRRGRRSGGNQTWGALRQEKAARNNEGSWGNWIRFGGKVLAGLG